MKTAYYTFAAWEDNVQTAGSGGTPKPRRKLTVSRPVERADGNVIDLNAWKAANPALSGPEPEEERTGRLREQGEPPAPRRRRDHRRALFAAELLSTLAVAGAAAALMLRALLF